MTSFVGYTVAEGVATLLLDRPDKRNAMTVQMWQDLEAVCGDLATDETVRTVVVRGAGASFCSGADVSALSEDDATMKQVVAGAERALRQLPVPTVAMVHGHCWGAGMQIAVACDLRVAATDASFAVPPARLGVIYPEPSMRAMVALVGPSAAKRLVFTAAAIDGTTAAGLGLVDLAVAPERLEEETAALVASFAGRSLLSQCAAKALVNTLADGGDAEAVYEHWRYVWDHSSDGPEGPAAFLEKRPARFDWHPTDPIPVSDD